MRAVVQRVTQASVTVAGEVVGKIAQGLVVLLAVGKEDQREDVAWMAEKLAELRIFEDDGGKMNRSVAEANGAILLISQFTLFGDCRQGRRPSFMDAALPEEAMTYYEQVSELLKQKGILVETGRFRANMQVALVNDGPVTLLLDSHKLF